MNLKEFRLSRGLTQKQFADRIGMTPRNYARWEQGHRKINTNSLIKISSAFNINISFIPNGEILYNVPDISRKDK